MTTQIPTEIKLCNNITTNISVRSKDDVLMDSLTEFFANKNHLNQMLPLITKRANISLRILDWFVTNYAKEQPTVYMLNDKPLNVHKSYKDQLTAFSKKRFDPFKRRHQKVDGKEVDIGIKFWYTNDKHIETTVGQLNFFKWAIQKNVLAYVVENLSDLVNKMLMSSKENKKKRKNIPVIGKTKTTKTGKKAIVVSSSKDQPGEKNTQTYTNLTVDTDEKNGEVSISATKTKMIT